MLIEEIKGVTKMEERTGLKIDVVMKAPQYDIEEEVSVDLPWDVISETLEEYFEYEYEIQLSGKDIWNMLIDLEHLGRTNELIDNLLEVEWVHDRLVQKYLDSVEYEEDYENWFEDAEDQYNWKHKLGIYAEESEEDEK